jgi:hypothetical protein
MKLGKNRAPQPASMGPAAVAGHNLTEQFAVEYAKSAVPNMLKAIETVKRYNRATLIGALVTSYLHQAHYLASIGAGYFAYLPPAIFDTAMVSMLIVVRTHGIARDAKRWAMAVFCGAALFSAVVNFAAPGDLGLRIVFALVVVLVIGVELVAGRIRPDFTAIDKQASELLAAANKISANAVALAPPATKTQAPAPDGLTEKPATAVPESVATQQTPDVPARLVSAARMITMQHRQISAESITADELAARLNTTPAIAGQLLTVIDNPDPTRINGNIPALGGTR